MSNITNNGLTRSGTWCFIAVGLPISQQCVKGLKASSASIALRMHFLDTFTVTTVDGPTKLYRVLINRLPDKRVTDGYWLSTEYRIRMSYSRTTSVRRHRLINAHSAIIAQLTHPQDANRQYSIRLVRHALRPKPSTASSISPLGLR